MNKAVFFCTACGVRILALDGRALYCIECGGGPFCIECYLKHRGHKHPRIAPPSKGSDWVVGSRRDKAAKNA